MLLPLRAGAPVELRGFRGEHIALNRNNVEWVLVKGAKSMAWPGALAYWLSQGRPPSPWRVVGKRGDALLIRRVGEKAESEPEA